MASKARKPRTRKTKAQPTAETPEKALAAVLSPPAGRPSALIDTRVIYCGDCLDQLRKLPEQCIDLIYIDPPFNSNRNYEVFWGETKQKRNSNPTFSMVHGRSCTINLAQSLQCTD